MTPEQQRLSDEALRLLEVECTYVVDPNDDCDDAPEAAAAPRQVNRATKALGEAKLDLWEQQYFAGRRTRARRWAKVQARRALRRLSRLLTGDL